MNKSPGFTLIELILTVAIIGILAAIAVPNYNNYVMKSRRADATSLMLEMAGKQVRFHSENNTYATKVGDLGYGAAANTIHETESGSYDVQVVAGADAISFELTATPKNAQNGDKCGTLGYNSAGAKTFTGTGVTLDDCW